MCLIFMLCVLIVDDVVGDVGTWCGFGEGWRGGGSSCL